MFVASLPSKLSVREYDRWIASRVSRQASQKKFFNKGVDRTRRVLAGTASQGGVGKWRSFGARHYKQYKQNPTARRRVALLNWGFDVKRARGEKYNLAEKYRGEYGNF